MQNIALTHSRDELNHCYSVQALNCFLENGSISSSSIFLSSIEIDKLEHELSRYKSAEGSMSINTYVKSLNMLLIDEIADYVDYNSDAIRSLETSDLTQSTVITFKSLSMRDSPLKQLKHLLSFWLWNSQNCHSVKVTVILLPLQAEYLTVACHRLEPSFAANLTCQSIVLEVASRLHRLHNYVQKTIRHFNQRPLCFQPGKKTTASPSTLRAPLCAKLGSHLFETTDRG